MLSRFQSPYIAAFFPRTWLFVQNCFENLFMMFLPWCLSSLSTCNIYIHTIQTEHRRKSRSGKFVQLSIRVLYTCMSFATVFREKSAGFIVTITHKDPGEFPGRTNIQPGKKWFLLEENNNLENLMIPISVRCFSSGKSYRMIFKPLCPCFI